MTAPQWIVANHYSFTVQSAAVELDKSTAGIYYLLRNKLLSGDKVMSPDGKRIWLISAESVAKYKEAAK